MINRISLCVWAMLMLLPAGVMGVQLQGPDEKVVVTANVYPVPFENLARTVVVLTHNDIERMPVRSITDVLSYASSVDIHERGPLGMQADVSVRGSSYSQVLILVDGMRINDSQTAHHNADFPVQLEDVERIEVLYGSGSALYGADAVGGIVNIITRRRGDPLHASFTAGQFGLAAGFLGVRFGKGNLVESMSASADRSSGFMENRDFRSFAFSSRTAIGERSSLFVSHTNKEFGAAGFYGPAPSREWTNQTMISFQRSLGQRQSRTLVQSFYRTHGDRFLYDVRTPGLYENRHRTHAAGVVLKTQWMPAPAVFVNAGGEAGFDAIASSNLGDHAYGRTSLFGEIQWKPWKSAALYGGFRADYYSNFGFAASPSISASWWLRPRVKLRLSMARSFRIPNFTELYYHDPNNIADPSIKPETAWSGEAGADFLPARNWMASLTLFLRRERNAIDWVRKSTGEKWHTANLGRVDTGGVELGLERSFSSAARLALHYTYANSNADSFGYISKYVLDYARHAWTTAGSFRLPLELDFGPSLRYVRRADGRGYWLLDAGMSRRIRNFTVSVDGTNLLDKSYQEVVGVDMPGRWITFTLKATIPGNVR